jgi:RNA polymerase sigma factor (sigma-70 family)
MIPSDPSRRAEVVARLFKESLDSGELDRQLRERHRRWRHVLDYGEFRDRVLDRAWDARETFRGESGAELAAWIRRVSWSAAVDLWREHKRQSALRARAARFLPRFVLPEAPQVETADLVEWLLAGLTERERKLLRLKYFDGLTAEQLAAALETTSAGVSQLHYRALEKLRARSKDCPG